MSDRLRPIDFQNILYWILKEYSDNNTIWGIPSSKFFFKKSKNSFKIFNGTLDTPVGPAAGPHTQMAPNIAAAYLTGGRFFELKTVQKLDNLKIDKPCIDAEDEAYNVEWSQELSLEQSYPEYLKAWFLLHFLNSLFNFSSDDKGFVFNISVGYDLEGIKSPAMDSFIEKMKDASATGEFFNYKKILGAFVNNGSTRSLIEKIFPNKNDLTSVCNRLNNLTENISPNISNSVTLSTMHGCPSNEIESIAKYLIEAKKLNTFIKLNPTLLGYEYVKDTLSGLGYSYIELNESSFSHDLKFDDAITLIKRLKEFSAANKKDFGIKLSNTLGVNNKKGILPGGQMYMSGRSLFALTINLANRIAGELNGEINISYSGGATIYNVKEILETGIFPVTMVTELLKPGGYLRLFQIAEEAEKIELHCNAAPAKINLLKLKELAENASVNPEYKKDKRPAGSLKINKALPKYDCYISPCTEACPVHQDVSEYISFVRSENYGRACKIITLKNPLPNITGYICDHQCMTKCARLDYEGAVSIRELKKEAAERGLEDYLSKANNKSANPQTGIKAAVIGAGPTGLSAAYFLSKAGFDVTVFEKSDRAGGTVQHVIPAFRLPQSAIDKDIEFVKQFGVKFIYNSYPNFSISKLERAGFKYLFIGIGATQSNHLDFTGSNIYEAIDFLKSFNQNAGISIGENVAVIGGGNSAMDAARASLRIKGVKKVYILYRRTIEFMPADKEELDSAVAEGVIFKELLLPVSFNDKKLICRQMQLGETDIDGRRKVLPLENRFVEFEIDSVISAIGEHADWNILGENNIVDSGGTLPIVDYETNETKIKNIYIGGDALRGPSTVIESIADGKKAAESIMMKEGIQFDESETFSEAIAADEKIKSIQDRRGNIFINKPLDSNKEAERCLECNLLCNKCVEVCPNRANIAIKTGTIEEGLKDFYQILHLDGLCNECGNCQTFCPYTDAPYKIKTTLFRTKEDFLDSENDGFYFERSEKGANNFIVRYNSTLGNVSFNPEGEIIYSSFGEASKELSTFSNLIRAVFTSYDYLVQK